MERTLAMNGRKQIPTRSIELQSKKKTWKQRKRTMLEKSMKSEWAIMPNPWSEEEEEEDFLKVIMSICLHPQFCRETTRH